MSGSEKINFAEGAVAEVELDAHALLELSPSPAIGLSVGEGDAALCGPQPRETTIPVTPSESTPPPRSFAELFVPDSPMKLVVGCVAIATAIVAIATRHVQSTSEPAPEPATMAASQVTLAVEPPKAPPADDLPPVIFENPFDESEVFEFPPGTSTEEARQAVADFLIQRAIDRQKQFDDFTGQLSNRSVR